MSSKSMFLRESCLYRPTERVKSHVIMTSVKMCLQKESFVKQWQFSGFIYMNVRFAFFCFTKCRV